MPWGKGRQTLAEVLAGVATCVFGAGGLAGCGYREICYDELMCTNPPVAQQEDPKDPCAGDPATAPAVDGCGVFVRLHGNDAGPGTRSEPFGTLVHASLATVSLDADTGAIAQVVRIQGRIVAAPEAEVAAAIDVVRAALAHPLFDDARARPARCLRETPVTASVDGVLVEGIVDLAFETEGGMTVVDFKTDRAEGERFEQYRRQLGLYADAIASATGRPVRAVLLEL